MIARRLFTLIVCFALLPAAHSHACDAAAPKEAAPSRVLQIRAQGGQEAWDASIENVEAVLHAAAAELWRHFPDRKLDAILVGPTGGPIVLYRRGANGEYYVRLNTGDTFWAQYAFQFAHEFTHILCGYREGDSGNLWFEEMLCELGSLYVLRSMAQTWKTTPPYENWKDFAPKLADYAQARLQKAALPADTTLAQWYERNAAALAKDAHDRDRNALVAAALLPVMEKSPASWEAVSYLNAKKGAAKRSFAQYLSDWHATVPRKHKAFVEDVAGRLGVKLIEPPKEP